MEVESPEDFLKVSDNVNLIIRVDPFIIANYYGIFMFLDLRKLKNEEIRKTLIALKDKIVNVKRHIRATTLEDLLKD